MAQEAPDHRKRRFLVAATGVAGGVVTAAAAVPFVASMLPSERAKAAGAPVDVDISKLPSGQMMTIAWRGKPVWVVNRTPEMLQDIKACDDRVADPGSKESEQPKYAQNEYRSIKPQYLVCVGICTHLGCSPVGMLKAESEPFDSDWKGGFYCPCHGSLYDLAGRVYKNKPAPLNLVVPPYRFLSDTKIVIGEDTKGG